MNNWPIKRRIPFIFLLLLVVGYREARAQDTSDVHATGSNLLRYGTGSTTNALGNAIDKQYFEEIADARIFYQNFQLGLRYEMDDPSEVGRSYPATLGEGQGPEFRRRWLAYKNEDVDLQAGDVSALFGRGLAVNLFESRALNYDSWLDGVFGRGEYKIPNSVLDLDASVKVQAVGGQETFFPVDTTEPPMSISARSANAEFGFFNKKIVLGASFVQAFTGANQLESSLPSMTNREVNEPDFYANVNSGHFEAFLEWTENRTHVNQLLGTPIDTSHTGHAGYGSLSYSNSVIGLTFEYKNYSYFIHNPGDLLYNNVFSKLPIASPPEVYKDFTFTSITRTTHAVNFDDELGYQLEANITAIPQFVIDLDAAASSAHDKYNSTGVTVDSSNVFPKLSDQGFYPFWEVYAEAEWDFDKANNLNFVKFAIHHRNDVIAYNSYMPSETDYRWTTTVAGKVQYETAPNQSFLGMIEHQWEYDASLQTSDKRRINELVTMQYSYDPTISFGGVFDYAFFYANEPIGLDETTFGGWNLHLWGNAVLDHLPEFFVALRIGQSHSMQVSYGAERGGLICTGGICRVLPPFDGLRFTLTSQF